MKKKLSMGLMTLAVLGLMLHPAYDQNAEDIIDKMLEAQGGRDLLETIKDVTISGSLELVQMGLNGTITVYSKTPKMRRSDIEVMGMLITQAYDGTKAWMVNPQTGAEEEMPEQLAAYAEREAIGVDGILHPEKYGITFEFKGKETVEGKDYFHVEQTYSDGYKASVYIDPETYLLYKSKGITLNNMGVEVVAESYPSDFRKVNGMMVAHAITIFQDSEEYLNLAIDEVKTNSGLEDSLFKMSQ